MYDWARTYLTAPRLRDAPAGADPGAAAPLALGRVRKLLTAYAPGLPVDGARLRAALGAALPQPAREAERLFALGWLRWLEGEAVAAELLLAEAGARARQAPATAAPQGEADAAAGLPPLGPGVLLARAAYWHARVRLRRGRAEAVAEFEAVLRTLGGSPQATAWFVDLLWRGGRLDRAEQVWKSLRGNRRVSGCDEGPLLEARALLRRGELAPAERVLQEAAPAGGVAWVERRLLLAWALAALRQPERARAAFAEAQQGPYPAAALAEWGRLLEGHARGLADEADGPVPPALQDFVRGQQARAEGDAGAAAAAYRAALASPVAQPFARYALAALGQEDAAAVLAAQPGLFLALRCRARLALERFRQRQGGPAELLDALQQAGASGFRLAAADHFRDLARALQERQPDAARLRELAAGAADAGAPQRRNSLRAALEVAGRRSPAPEALGLLREWARADVLAGDEGLRRALGQQLLRLALLQRDAAALADVAALRPGEPLLALAQAALAPEQAPVLGEAPTAEAPAFRLWQLARALPSGADDRWREEVRALRGQARLKPLAQALLVQEASERGDVAAVAGLLDEVDAWRGFRAGPPPFVLRAVEAAVASQPGHPAWQRTLGRWLAVWDLSALGAAGATLAAQAGLAGGRPGTVEAPAGVRAGPWFLHQAARALGRDDAGAALALVRRALALEGELPDAEAVAAALPELERRAAAQALAACLAPVDGTAAGGLLADLVGLLPEAPGGAAVLEAAERGDGPAARAALAALAERPGLPPRLAHHLALLETRAAQALEGREQWEEAAPHWRRAWGCWLALLAALGPEAVPADGAGALLDWLLGLHRRRVNDLLARDETEGARRHWSLVEGLPALAAPRGEELGGALAGRVARFRDDLATEYLLTTREAMRYGAIPEGWRADYPKGLGYLCRLLELDRDNPRLLTALVEVCAEWFFDLYNVADPAALREQVERYTPFALHLARLVEGRPADLSARAALADFYKFRGFVSAERARKVELYREALRFNPGNGNVRELLADLGEPVDGPSPETEQP
jgi:hypothetical protein